MHTERIDEFAIKPQTFIQIHSLLQTAFPEFPTDRPFYKLRPHFRYLVWDEDTLTAHMAVDHRVIRVGTQPLSIFGVIDLCVAPAYQRRQLATQLLRHLELLAHKTQREAIVLFADDHRLYVANGYELIETPCTWMMVDEYRTHGITEQSLDDCMLVIV